MLWHPHPDVFCISLSWVIWKMWNSHSFFKVHLFRRTPCNLVFSGWKKQDFYFLPLCHFLMKFFISPFIQAHLPLTIVLAYYLFTYFTDIHHPRDHNQCWVCQSMVPWTCQRCEYAATSDILRAVWLISFSHILPVFPQKAAVAKHFVALSTNGVSHLIFSRIYMFLSLSRHLSLTVYLSLPFSPKWRTSALTQRTCLSSGM